MILRNPREGREGQTPDNIFEAVEPRSGEVVSSCIVYEEQRDVLYPERPYHVRLAIDGDTGAIDSLMGASIARARALCAARNEGAVIYAPCYPEDEELIEVLEQYGFRNNDSLDRLYAELPAQTDAHLPMGCVVVHDKLEDPQEQRYFLDRYNEIYGVEMDTVWLGELRRKPGFRRILTVAPTGMAGEILVWFDGECGVIEFFDTARRWRNMGVARYMLNLACQYIHNSGVNTACADVRRSMTPAVKSLRSAGFTTEEKLMCYPTIEL